MSERLIEKLLDVAKDASRDAAPDYDKFQDVWSWYEDEYREKIKDILSGDEPLC